MLPAIEGGAGSLDPIFLRGPGHEFGKTAKMHVLGRCWYPERLLPFKSGLDDGEFALGLGLRRHGGSDPRPYLHQDMGSSEERPAGQAWARPWSSRWPPPP